MELLQYIGATLGILGMAGITMSPSKVVLAMAVTASSCVVMGLYGLLTAQYGIALAQLVYLVLNIYGVYRWRKVNVQSD